LEIITIQEAYKMSSLHPFSLLVSKNIKGVVNVMGGFMVDIYLKQAPKINGV